MSKKRILIIDDEKNFTDIARFLLKESGKYEVMTENRASLGLVAAKQFKPDLILLDIVMPEMDGGSVCIGLKGDEDTKNIPVVFLTAIAEQKIVDESDGIIGGHPFIAKPVTREKLIDCIEKNIA